MNNKKDPFKGLFYGADGRGRTGTRVEPHKILSLARLPIPSHRLI